MELRFYTPKEIAKLLKVTPQVIYELIHSGRLPAMRLGKRYRITSSDLESFVRESKVGTPGGPPES